MAARAVTSKTVLHGSATVGSRTHRWIVGVFANKAAAAMYAGMVKAAHSAGDTAQVIKLDPNCATDAENKPLTPVKLAAQEVQYNPHMTAANGLDEE